MKVTNDSADEGGALQQFLQLQADFQARLADETMRYLRRLQTAVAPGVPGTVVVPDPDARLEATAAAGSELELALEVENCQGVHCVVTPALSALVHASGTAWFPDADLVPSTALVPPGETATLRLGVSVPDVLPPGPYHGVLLLHGFSDRGVTTTITVADTEASPT